MYTCVMYVSENVIKLEKFSHSILPKFWPMTLCYNSKGTSVRFLNKLKIN